MRWYIVLSAPSCLDDLRYHGIPDIRFGDFRAGADQDDETVRQADHVPCWNGDRHGCVGRIRDRRYSGRWADVRVLLFPIDGKHLLLAADRGDGL